MPENPETGLWVLAVLLGTPVAWTLALANLFKRPPAMERLLLGGFFFSVGIWHLAGALASTGWIYLYPWQYRTEIPFTWLTGPLGYFYFRIKLEDDFRWRTRHLVYFLPGLLAFLIYVPLAGVPDRVAFIRATIDRTSFDPYQTLVVAGAAQNLFYLLLGGWRFFYPGRYALRKTHRVLLMLLVFFAFALTLLDWFSWHRLSPLDLGLSVRLFTLSTSGALVAILLVSLARPGFMNELVERIQAGRYSGTRLAGMDLDALGVQLTRLMEEEEIYLRSDLSLAGLAAELDLNGPQLSQFVNQQFGKNFNAYVNEYRVGAACRLMGADPRATVLNVCYAVGFNTPSSFHTAFKAVTGRTPADYKKNPSKS